MNPENKKVFPEFVVKEWKRDNEYGIIRDKYRTTLTSQELQ